MKMKRVSVKKVMAVILSAAMLTSITACGNSQTTEVSDQTTTSEQTNSTLDPANPATIIVWNYYNGDQLLAFESLVEEFNATVGLEKGIVAVTVSQGDIDTLADSLLASVEGKAGAQECPTLAAVYAETAYILDEMGALASIDDYFTEEELAEYVPGFIEEGRFNEDNDLMLFPINKSTEVFTANETDWAPFAEETGITLESIQTKEDLTAAAERYYEWTDAMTPDVPEDGKSLYGRDSVSNYIYLGSYQLGHEMFQVEDGEVKIDLDRDTFKTLWDNYYIPYINGYFGAYAKFRSEDAKIGKILALTSSSSSVGYLPTEVTMSDDSVHPITCYTRESLPFANAQTDAVVQQGANYCMLDSTEQQEEAAAEFLKWFTEPEQNMEFATASAYSPVKIEANTEEAITKACEKNKASIKNQNVLETLLVSANSFTNSTAYATKPFHGSKEIRSLLDHAMDDLAIDDRAAVVEAIEAGVTREEAVASYSTDEYFDAWFDELCEEVETLAEED